MASAAVFSSLRRLRTPSLEPLLANVQISEVSILETLSTMLADLISKFTDSKTPRFQRKNSRNLIRKLEVFAVLLECLMDSSSGNSVKLSSTQSLCFKELYLVLYRSKILVDYCLQSSKLWLLLQNNTLSGHFHDLNQEISTLLDVFPLVDWNLPSDVTEQVKLLKTQSRKSRFFVDRNDEILRLKLYSFLNEFEREYIPERMDLYSVFVKELGITDVRSCRVEIEFLEEQIVNHDGDIEPTASVLTGLVALTRYCRFSLFGFDEDEVELKMRKNKKQNKGLISAERAETFITFPKDFCCPISLDLMNDPVIISTGQTYERSSIARWIDDGHNTCPKGRQKSGIFKKGKWKTVSSILISKGYQASPQQCEDKFNDLNKRYKKLNDILGRSISCKVVENPGLLEQMTRISPKTKEVAKKLLSSKHLFYKEMSAYHNGLQIPHCSDAEIQIPSADKKHSDDSLSSSRDKDGCKGKDVSDSEDEDASEEDLSDDNSEYGNLDSEERAGNGKLRFSTRLENLQCDMKNIFNDPTKSKNEQKEWIRKRMLELEEERIEIQAEALELGKRRVKWQKFCDKKESELEMARLEKERLMLENERETLELKKTPNNWR